MRKYTEFRIQFNLGKATWYDKEAYRYASYEEASEALKSEREYAKAEEIDTTYRLVRCVVEETVLED